MQVLFGTGLLGSSALEQRDFVVEFGPSYAGVLNPPADLQILGDSARGYSVVTAIAYF